jgi:hypothetical protein
MRAGGHGRPCMPAAAPAAPPSVYQGTHCVLEPGVAPERFRHLHGALLGIHVEEVRVPAIAPGMVSQGSKQGELTISTAAVPRPRSPHQH